MDKLYRLVFKGELLTGHEPAAVRLGASQRLGANASQLDRLFSGKPVVLKRGLAVDVAARYASELRRLGMRMHLEVDGSAAKKDGPPGDYRIVFRGELVPGFGIEQVRCAAGERLNASPAQLATLFSGNKAVLKKGLDAERARRYASRLRNIGMVVAIESASSTSPTSIAPSAEPASPAAPPAVLSPTPNPNSNDFSHAVTLLHTPLMRASDRLHELGAAEAEMEFTQTMVDHELIATNAQNALPDLEKTELAGEATLQAYMRGEALPLMSVNEPAPVLPQVASIAGSTQAPAYESAAAPTERPLYVCTSCGARQARGRRCVHCGHEFPREITAATDASQVAASSSAGPVSVNPFAESADAGEPASAPARADRNLLVAAALVGIVLLAWWLIRR